MTETFFPPLPIEAKWPLQLILQNMKGDAGYLDKARAEGKWDAEWLDLLAMFSGARGISLVRGELVEDDMEAIDIPGEVGALFRELQDEKLKLGTKDNAEKMAYFRTATSLLEKLISLKERAYNVHQVGQFYATVLAVMEEVLTIDQIGGVRERLHAARRGV